MEQQEVIEKQIARRSASIYLPLSFGVALAIWLLAGGYPSVARVGGAFWVWALTMIVSMPVVTSRVKRRLKAKLAA